MIDNEGTAGLWGSYSFGGGALDTSLHLSYRQIRSAFYHCLDLPGREDV